jgi:hypothetical protein
MKKQKENKISKFNIYDVEDVYKPSNDVFNEDDIIIDRIKKVIYNTLDEPDRRIILAYAELGNVRDCAKLFKVSPSTIWNKIKAIKIKIIKEL